MNSNKFEQFFQNKIRINSNLDSFKIVRIAWKRNYFRSNVEWFENPRTYKRITKKSQTCKCLPSAAFIRKWTVTEQCKCAFFHTSIEIETATQIQYVIFDHITTYKRALIKLRYMMSLSFLFKKHWVAPVCGPAKVPSRTLIHNEYHIEVGIHIHNSEFR